MWSVGLEDEFGFGHVELKIYEMDKWRCQVGSWMCESVETQELRHMSTQMVFKVMESNDITQE